MLAFDQRHGLAYVEDLSDEEIQSFLRAELEKATPDGEDGRYQSLDDLNIDN